MGTELSHVRGLRLLCCVHAYFFIRNRLSPVVPGQVKGEEMQSDLFVEDLQTALMDVVRAVGGPKKTGALMRPELPADESGKWVTDCLNKAKREKLSLEQILFLLKMGRQHGCHTAINFIAAETGYSNPSPVDPEDESAALQRMFMESVKAQEQIVKRLEKLQPALRSVA